MPDFVFRPQQQRNGPGLRKLGDGILVCGPRAAVLQSKSRKTSNSDSEKERGWLDKSINKAFRQAGGTIRRLTNTPATLTNARGRSIRVDGNAHEWFVGGDHRPHGRARGLQSTDRSAEHHRRRADTARLGVPVRKVDCIGAGPRYLRNPAMQERRAGGSKGPERAHRSGSNMHREHGVCIR